MNFLPISVNIEDETILIIGGGHVAIHKIESLERFTHNITVIAPEIVPEIRKRSFIKIVEKLYEPTDLNGHLLVYAATDDQELNSRIRQDGRQFRCLVNVVDKPSNCDFVSPAIYKKDHMTVAVSSNGENVYGSLQWRNAIRDKVESGEIAPVMTKEQGRKVF